MGRSPTSSQPRWGMLPQGGEDCWRGSISRILSPMMASTGDGHSSWRPIARPLIAAVPRIHGRAAHLPVLPCSRRGLPCAAALARGRWALTPPFHRNRSPRATGRLVFCDTFPQSPEAAVSGRPALRSPDFPTEPGRIQDRSTVRPPPTGRDFASGRDGVKSCPECCSPALPGKPLTRLLSLPRPHRLRPARKEYADSWDRR